MGHVRAARTRKCSACTALEKITNTFLWLVSAGDVRPISRFFFLSQLSNVHRVKLSASKASFPIWQLYPTQPLHNHMCVLRVFYMHCHPPPPPPWIFRVPREVDTYVYALSNIYPKHSVIFSWKPCQLRTNIQSVIMCVSIIFFTRFRTKKILESEEQEGTGDGKM